MQKRLLQIRSIRSDGTPTRDMRVCEQRTRAKCQRTMDSCMKRRQRHSSALSRKLVSNSAQPRSMLWRLQLFTCSSSAPSLRERKVSRPNVPHLYPTGLFPRGHLPANHPPCNWSAHIICIRRFRNSYPVHNYGYFNRRCCHPSPPSRVRNFPTNPFLKDELRLSRRRGDSAFLRRTQTCRRLLRKVAFSPRHDARRHPSERLSRPPALHFHRHTASNHLRPDNLATVQAVEGVLLHASIISSAIRVVKRSRLREPSRIPRKLPSHSCFLDRWRLVTFHSKFSTRCSNLLRHRTLHRPPHADEQQRFACTRQTCHRVDSITRHLAYRHWKLRCFRPCALRHNRLHPRNLP